MWDFKKANSLKQKIDGGYRDSGQKRNGEMLDEGHKVPLQHALCRTNTI